MQRTRRDALVAAVVGLFAGTFQAGCGAFGANAPSAPLAPKEQVSVEEEALLGANLDMAINSETKAAPGALQDYFQALLDQLSAAAGGDREGMILSVKVLDSPEIGNVFATPSGSIYITSGILLATADEAEVAAVISHELGHVARRHPLARLLRGLGVETVRSLAVSQSVIARDQKLNAALTAATYALLTGGAQLRYLPEEESAADARGLSYLEHENFDKGAFATFFGAPSKSEPNPLATMHAAHPLSLERLALMPQRQNKKKPRAAPALATLKDLVADQKAQNRRLATKKAKSSADQPGLEKTSARR
jgi:predicted Zn-dependent protease